MSKKIVSTDKAPSAIGAYSQAVCAGEFMYISGQLPINPDTGQFVSDDVREQTKQCIENIKAILEKENLSLDNVVKTTIFVKNINDFNIINNIYESYFGISKPARSLVEVANVPRYAKLEIEAIAYASVDKI